MTDAETTRTFGLFRSCARSQKRSPIMLHVAQVPLAPVCGVASPSFVVGLAFALALLDPVPHSWDLPGNVPGLQNDHAAVMTELPFPAATWMLSRSLSLSIALFRFVRWGCGNVARRRPTSEQLVKSGNDPVPWTRFVKQRCSLSIPHPSDARRIPPSEVHCRTACHVDSPSRGCGITSMIAAETPRGHRDLFLAGWSVCVTNVLSVPTPFPVHSMGCAEHVGCSNSVKNLIQGASSPAAFAEFRARGVACAHCLKISRAHIQ